MKLGLQEVVFFVSSIYMFVKQAVAIESDLTVDIQPGKRECFHQFVPADSSFDVEYQVIEGGDLDINFLVQSPSGRIMLSELKKTEGVHSIDTKEAGDHMFCFDNSFSRFSNKLTFFEIITEEPDPTWEKLNELDTAPAEDGQYEYEYKLEIFKGGLDLIKEKLDKTRQHQNILRVYESRDRSTQEHNFERVNFWSGIQLFVMVSVGLMQVLMIRSLFVETTSKPMKVST